MSTVLPNPAREPAEALQVDEEELGREGEELGQEPVAVERLQGYGSRPSSRLKPTVPRQSAGSKTTGPASARLVLVLVGRPGDDRRGVEEDALIQRADEVGLAAEVEPEGVHREVGELHPAEALEPEARTAAVCGGGRNPAGNGGRAYRASATLTGQRVTG